MGGLMEVELGRIAAQKGASDEVRQFGQRMVDDHSKANEELTRVVSSKGMTPPAALDAKHQAEMQKMSALSGEKFDKEYVKMMVSDHKKDVAEFQKEASSGKDADIKAFASSTLPTLQEHLQMIQRISSRGRGAPCLNIAGIHMAERRMRKKLLLGRIKPRNSKKCNVRLTHQRRLAPEPH